MNPIQKAEMLSVDEYLHYIKECLNKETGFFNKEIGPFEPFLSAYPVLNASVLEISGAVKVPIDGYDIYNTSTSVFEGNRKLSYKYPDFNIIDKYSYHWLKDKEYNSKYWPNLDYDFGFPWAEAFKRIVIKSVDPVIEFELDASQEIVDKHEFDVRHWFKRYRVCNEILKNVYKLSVTHGSFKFSYPLNEEQLGYWIEMTRVYKEASDKVKEKNESLEKESHAITLLGKLGKK